MFQWIILTNKMSKGAGHRKGYTRKVRIMVPSGDKRVLTGKETKELLRNRNILYLHNIDDYMGVCI